MSFSAAKLDQLRLAVKVVSAALAKPAPELENKAACKHCGQKFTRPTPKSAATYCSPLCRSSRHIRPSNRAGNSK
jgi:hypothetical protein